MYAELLVLIPLWLVCNVKHRIPYARLSRKPRAEVIYCTVLSAIFTFRYHFFYFVTDGLDINQSMFQFRCITESCSYSNMNVKRNRKSPSNNICLTPLCIFVGKYSVTVREFYIFENLFEN